MSFTKEQIEAIAPVVIVIVLWVVLGHRFVKRPTSWVSEEPAPYVSPRPTPYPTFPTPPEGITLDIFDRMFGPEQKVGCKLESVVERTWWETFLESSPLFDYFYPDTAMGSLAFFIFRTPSDLLANSYLINTFGWFPFVILFFSFVVGNIYMVLKYGKSLYKKKS